MGNVSMSNVQFIDRAIPPTSPYKPRKSKNIMLGLIAGIVTGVAFAFAFEYLDNTFKSPEDIEEYLGLPFIGLIPTIKSMQGAKRDEFLLTVTSPKSVFSEAFRNIRGNILLSTGDHPPQVIQICSAVFSEGKSTVCSNLATIMAAAGERVLIIDGDMRKPVLHKMFKISNARGLSSVLSGQIELDEAIRDTQVENVSIIPAGPISPNPTELLGSRTMKILLAELRQRYDRVIIDCPPYMGLADSSMLTTLTDGVLIVIRSGKTSRDLIYQTIKNMEMIKAKVLGVVLNDQSGTADEYYYYYSYNYNYYYGQEGKGRPKKVG
jgi:capsular exopolysaccharide synthesis family protein